MQKHYSFKNFLSTSELELLSAFKTGWHFAGTESLSPSITLFFTDKEK